MLSFFRKNTISDGELVKISRQYTNKNDPGEESYKNIEITDDFMILSFPEVGQDASTLLDLGYSSPDDLKETIYGECLQHPRSIMLS